MEKLFVSFATGAARIAGKPWTFLACVLIVLIWAATGPIFKFSETWQLIINTGTTIITFLMVFLIQNTQNRDGAAMQAKLDELIHAVRAADERFIGIEHMTEKDLDRILSEVEGRATRIHGEGPTAMPVVATRAEDTSAGTRRRAAATPHKAKAASPKRKTRA
ncbi:low affinity iron permease family protein [Brevundimonas sp.]|uniref:low affinity iron permease family protein n=1 Tax=Brevundimonas sp. TaxID=1871086 RepID=UPI002CDD97B3|nr:low affinity iron permease family protein [Brevundimonas sp.]HWQ86705.1 low affinity iron permease family protein [Brevundimonas sp.]